MPSEEGAFGIIQYIHVIAYSRTLMESILLFNKTARHGTFGAVQKQAFKGCQYYRECDWEATKTTWQYI